MAAACKALTRFPYKPNSHSCDNSQGAYSTVRHYVHEPCAFSKWVLETGFYHQEFAAMRISQQSWSLWIQTKTRCDLSGWTYYNIFTNVSVYSSCNKRYHHFTLILQLFQIWEPRKIPKFINNLLLLRKRKRPCYWSIWICGAFLLNEPWLNACCAVLRYLHRVLDTKNKII